MEDDNQIIPAQNGWYAVFAYEAGSILECAPVIVWELAGVYLRPLWRDDNGLLDAAEDVANYHGLIYAPHLIYINRRLYNAKGKAVPDLMQFRA